MTDISPQLPGGQESVPFWRDIRALGVIAQMAFLVAVIAGGAWILNNVAQNISSLGESQFLCADGSSSVRCAFYFLRLDAQFDISEAMIAYDPSDSYARALMVGALNTIKVAFFGIVLATALGTATGIARLSSNWLISSVARWYVDIIRNTPLLLQLFFLFFGVILLFPPIRDASQLLGLPIYLSQRGIDMPGPVFMPSFRVWLPFLALALAAGYIAYRLLLRRQERLEKPIRMWPWVALVVLSIAVVGWFVAVARGANNQGLLAAESSGYESLDDIVVAMQDRLGLSDLSEIDAALADGRLTEADLDAAALSICAVRDDPSEVNLTVQLRRANVPYDINRSNRLEQALGEYEDGDCEVAVATRLALTAGLDELPDGGAGQTILPLAETPVRIDIPQIEGLNFVGGIKLSPNFAAILIGLVIYTGAFIAEIVRAGIQSVPKGQSEAARALGLSEGQRLQLIVLPQALRVIIPPLTSQYLNLVKNSSLAIAVGYPDLWSTAFTTLNQSGRAIQVFLIVMATYLSFSLIISAFLNWYNRRIALVER